VNGRFQNPQRGECDLVMKGGITSGVVYPQAILMLAEEYRFRSLGGGSVGAIAAALAAAAELGRQNGGFEQIEQEQEKLTHPGFLLELFSPTKSTKPLMNTLLGLMEVKQRGGSVLRALSSGMSVVVRNNLTPFAKGALVGAALGVAFVLVLAVATATVLSGVGLVISMLVLGLASGFLGGVIWVLFALLRILIKVVPSENFYGMSTGHEDHEPNRPRVLTDWLSALLDRIAWKREGNPLTFADLKGDTNPNGEVPNIDLRVLTTNLNHTEPYVFPRAFNTFIFNTEEMRKFFPSYVVNYMERNAPSQEALKLPHGYHFLPQGDTLPVVVPMRMAVSFPVLLSAVPLYTVKAPPLDAKTRQASQHVREVREADLQRNWFSDGGICSNFPIHFFDAWLPQRPTFGINLTSLLEETNTIEYSVTNVGEELPENHAKSQPERDDGYVWLPTPEESDQPEWTGFGGLIGFGRAVFRSAQNYRDNMQSRLPSYQERIVQVRLRKEEGGLNLAMEPPVIERLEARGRKAGRRLLDEFRFEHHRWVRLRVLLNQLEANLKEAGPDQLDPPVIAALLQDQSEKDFPFNDDTSDQEWIVQAQKRIEQLRTLIEEWDTVEPRLGEVADPKQKTFFRSVTDTEPQPELRVTPNV
jgi:predicted acylesterase/phospholipase RssA